VAGSFHVARRKSCCEVPVALSTLVAREKPGFQVLSKGLLVLLYAEVVRQGVPDHGGALHGECLAANSSGDVDFDEDQSRRGSP